MNESIKCQRCGAPFEVGLARWQSEGDRWRSVPVLKCAIARDCRLRRREAAERGVNQSSAA